MARNKFRIDENEVMDAIKEKGVSEERITLPEPIEPDKKEAKAPAAENKVIKQPHEKVEISERKNADIPKDDNGAIPIAQPGFNYRKKKEKRDVKKLVLITPSMNEYVMKLLETTYDGMPFNMLINALLKEFLEKHNISIDDDSY